MDSNEASKKRQAHLEWHRAKAGDYCSIGAGVSISHRGSDHGAGGSGSSSDVVVLQRREYYQLEAKVKNLEEELSQLRRDRFGPPPQ